MSVPWEVKLTRHEGDLDDDGHDAVENLVTVETDTTLVAAPNGAGGVAFRAETGSSGSSMVPYYIAPGETFTVPLYSQALFAMLIDNAGTLVVNGYLLEVD